MPKPEEDFTSIIEQAQRTSGDLGGMFGTPNNPARVAFEHGRQQAGPQHDYEAHAEVFNLPADKDSYQDVINLILRGDAIKQYEDRTFDKEGNFLIAILYFTPLARPVRINDQDAGDAEPMERPRRLP